MNYCKQWRKGNYSPFSLQFPMKVEYPTNQTIHNLQLEFETLKVTNVNLIKQIAWQQSRIKELETSERVIVEQLTIPEQPIIHSVPVDTPQTTPETSYLDYIPHEMIIVVVGALELARQVIMPKWKFN